MATGSIVLSIGSAIQPDGTASNEAPAIQRVKSSASPAPYFLQAAFDASTIERLMWSFQMPATYAGSPVLRCAFKMASATSGNVVLAARMAAVSPGDSTDVDALTFDSVVSSGAVAVPGTAGYLTSTAISLTNNASAAAGDFVVIYLARDASNGSDSATGDLELVDVLFEFAT